MIGQRRNLDLIDRWVADGCPQFICISGQRGSGKRMLAKYIADKLGKSYSEVGIKVDEVREVIDSATKYGGFYVFADADGMSTNAKNALLKITEEPPKDTHFVVTVQDEASLLDTIKSRAQMIRLEPYTKKDLIDYGCRHPESDILKVSYDIASTPQELDMLVSYGQEFIDYVNLVIDNIREVEPANAFKSAGKLALKDEPDKYNLGIFFSTVITICRGRLREAYDRTLAEMILITSKYYTQQSKLGVSLIQLYDNWVFEVRAI
jgi:hypothetical protein